MLLSMRGHWAGRESFTGSRGIVAERGRDKHLLLWKKAKNHSVRDDDETLLCLHCVRNQLGFHVQTLDGDGFVSLCPLVLMMCFTKSSQVMIGQKTAPSPLPNHHDHTTIFKPLTENVWSSWLVYTVLGIHSRYLFARQVFLWRSLCQFSLRRPSVSILAYIIRLFPHWAECVLNLSSGCTSSFIREYGLTVVMFSTMAEILSSNLIA